MRKSGLSILLFLLLTAVANAQEKYETTLFWDTSYSMMERDLSREMEYLSSYIATRPELELTLILFGQRVYHKETYSIQKGEWGALRKTLGEVAYDGATSYADLQQVAGEGEILIFTDGRQNLYPSQPTFSGPLRVINSLRDFDRAGINLLLLLNEALFVNLAVPGSQDSPEPLNYYGTVYTAASGPEGVMISILGREQQGLHPQKDGSFEISGQPGDVLLVAGPAGNQREYKLGSQRNINLYLAEDGGIQLKEVVVTESRKSEVETVLTATGQKNPDAVGYTRPSIGPDRISDASTSAANAAQGKFSGVRLPQNGDLSKAEIRSKWSILSNNYGLVVIDGVPMAKSNSSAYFSASANQKTDFIDPKNIAEITVLKGLSATNRYGSLGANGVILITTKTASGLRTEQQKDRARVQNNIYEGKISGGGGKKITAPYVKSLEAAGDLPAAYALYLQQRTSNLNTDTYFVDVADFFRPLDPALAYQILSTILEKDKSSQSEMKALLFKAYELEDAELLMRTAARIAEDFPGRIESFLDLALAHIYVGEYQTGLNILLQMAGGTANPTLDFTGLQKTIDQEIRSLVLHHKKELDLSKVPAKYLNPVRYDARILVDWNDPQAEFELRFVNPQKRFFTWEHSSQAEPQRLRKEQEEGYGKEEFEIIGDMGKGEWQINVKFLGAGSRKSQPVAYLRCRIEYDFGQPGQRSESRLLRLEEVGKEEILMRFRID